MFLPYEPRRDPAFRDSGRGVAPHFLERARVASDRVPSPPRHLLKISNTNEGGLSDLILNSVRIFCFRAIPVPLVDPICDVFLSYCRAASLRVTTRRVVNVKYISLLSPRPKGGGLVFCSIKFWLYDSNFMAIRGQFFPRPSRSPIRGGETRVVSPVPDIPSTREHSRCSLRTEFNRLVLLKWQIIAKYCQGNEG